MDVDPIKVDQKTILSITIMKTKNIISGDVFVIPNDLCTAKDMWDEEVRHGMYVSAIENHIHFDAEKTKFIELWFCTPDSSTGDSNWRDHCIDSYSELATYYK